MLKELVEQSSNDNKKSFYETKDNIEKNSQKEAGVILSDGTVVDGNRRFACLLELYEETKDERFATFETTWFPAPAANDVNKQRMIKEMEFDLQYNNDPIRKYSRIASLESFYHDTLCPNTRSFNKNDYCEHTGMKPSQYDSDKRVVEIMRDYLDFIKHPNEFWIIQQKGWATVLEQIANIKFDEEQWIRAREAVYTYIASTQEPDVTKNVKKLVDSINKGTPMFKEFHEQFYDELDHDDILKVKNAITAKYSNVNNEISIAQDEDLNQIGKKIDSIFDQCKFNQDVSDLESEPISILNQLLKNATNLADNDCLRQMNAIQEDEFKTKLDKLQAVLNKIKSNFN